MGLKTISEEVLYAGTDVVRVNRETIQALKDDAARNRRRRIRLCAHPGEEDGVHEMLIVHAKDTYVRPHRHLNKSESFHVIEGAVDVVLFDDEGRIDEVIRMGGYETGLEFFYRLNHAVFHTLSIRSDFVVFHETTRGPFRRTDSEFAAWSPNEDDGPAVNAFIQKLKKDLS